MWISFQFELDLFCCKISWIRNWKYSTEFFHFYLLIYKYREIISRDWIYSTCLKFDDDILKKRYELLLLYLTMYFLLFIVCGESSKFLTKTFCDGTEIRTSTNFKTLNNYFNAEWLYKFSPISCPLHQRKFFSLRCQTYSIECNTSLGLNNDKINLKAEPKEPRLILNLSIIEKE